MNLIDLKEIEQFCADLAIKAGEKIMEVYDDPNLFSQTEVKGDKSPLTLADKRANDLIVAGLKKKFPDFAILSEEEKDDLSRRENPFCFIVDPLDGTKEFIKRNGQFTVNIALAEHQKVIMGVIYVPATGDLYYASKENGSFYKSPQGEVAQNKVSTQVGLREPSKIRLVMSASHGAPEMDALIEKYNFTNFVKMGSSLKGCLVARGEAEIYYRHGPTCEWDTAAMQCIVEEAGGVFRQMDGSEMVYNRENTRNEKGFFAINSKENQL
ncbi:MAG: 3'(2'),5'-bisphosphate nucleotidase CysQ [Eubacteriales bacterium]